MKDYDFVTRKYASLTSKMLTFAECLENRCCDGDDRGYLIWRKYNISIVEKALEKLQNNLSLESLVEIAGDLMMYKDPRAVEPLIQALQVPLSQITDPNENMGVRALAARILGCQHDSRAVEPFILALRDGYRETRYEAALALRDIGDERAVEPLIEALRDEHSDTRCQAALALREIGDERAVEPLIEALRDSECNVRRVAIEALTKLISKFPQLGDARTVSVLIATLKDNDHNNWNYRAKVIAAKTLRQSKDEGATNPLIDTLIEALEDSESEFRPMGEWDLKEIRRNIDQNESFICYNCRNRSESISRRPSGCNFGRIVRIMGTADRKMGESDSPMPLCEKN